MSEGSTQKSELKKNWTLTSSAFRRLLDWLDEGANSDGQKYLSMRQRLVMYFDRKSCATPDELADETLNRVARRLEEADVDSETPARYCYIVARFIFMEHLRDLPKLTVPLDGRERAYSSDVSRLAAGDEEDMKERRLTCLEQCAGKLEPLQRNLIFRYYTGKERIKIENRRNLAAELGITINALSIRACRIRDTLEVCVRQCAGME